MSKKLRIGIDCRLAGSAHGGIGRYIENLIIHLPTENTKFEWVFFFFDRQQLRAIFPEGQLPANCHVIYAPIRHYTLKEQLRMPSIFYRAKLDALHVPHFNIPWFYFGKTIVTIHDLLWHEYKGRHVTTLSAWQYWIKHLVYTWTVQQAVNRAHSILVPAQTIKDTITKYYPRCASKIVVTKEGIAEPFLLAGKKKLGDSSAGISPTLVYVGSLYPHKNVRVVIDSLEKLPNYKLALVGTRNVFQDEVRKYVELKKLTNKVQFLGYLADEELIELYRQATALVQPSLSEGFGLTGVEAMAVGLPVIASDIPIFHEIYQQAALFFNPKLATSFTETVKRLEKSDRKYFIQQGKRVVKEYSWPQMAEDTLQVYQSTTSG
jgi:glycosyltransferase involved in cell wall biosynthesis